MTDSDHPIKRCRGKLTQSAFAEQFGVDDLTVSRWERGESIPHRKHQARLRELGVSFDEVLAASKAHGEAAQ